MLTLTIEEDCNICFESFTNDKIKICKNKKCAFKMCIECSKKYYKDNNKCPHCKIKINDKEDKRNFSIFKFLLFVIVVDIIAYFVGFLLTKQSSVVFILPNIIVGVAVIYFVAFLTLLLFRFMGIITISVTE